MKIVVAPDSFKGSLSAKEVALSIKKGIHQADESIEVITVPMADGGEGTVESLVDATNGKMYHVDVIDPLGREVKAFYGILGDGKTGVIEMASASGLPLLTRNERDPRMTTSYGTGQLIKHALDQGCKKLIIGLGGSATNDGGAGMLQALGVQLLDQQGKELPFGGIHLSHLRSIDISQADPRLYDTEFVIASDVNNPLIGPNGASYVFGPQKGADEQTVKALDQALNQFADVIKDQMDIAIHHLPGAGAAGGMGGAFLAFFQGTMEQGVQMVIKETKLEEKLQHASLVITGEGQMDVQTAYGKAPSGVALLAKKYGIPTIAIVGSIGDGVDRLREIGIESIFSIVTKPMTLEEAMENSDRLITYMTEQIIKVYLLKQ